MIIIPIWFIGQMTIFLKKQIEHRKDHLAVGNMKDQEREGTKTKCLNTQKWNPHITTIRRTFFTLLFAFASHFQIAKLIFYHLNLNPYEKSLLATNLMQMTLCLAVPLYMYAQNKSIFQHLIHEIFQIKRSEKLDSTKSKPIVLSTYNRDNDTIKSKNDMVLNQVQEGISDQVKEEPNMDYHPKCLTYQDQRALLAAARLKNAGFQLSNNTPEDGNCLIHALKDQMR